jgi:DeoR/GlpR family transcriptional regulator of sugar metabolism
MMTRERQALLRDILARDGRLVAATVAQDLGLSEDTIRRDLRQMAQRGLLLRVHGGALPLSPTDLPVDARMAIHRPEKERLGILAARIVRPGQVIFIDGGTTHLALAGALPADWSGTIITHSPAVAAACERLLHATTELLGGRIYRRSMVALGTATTATMLGMRVDIAFIGVQGLHETAGFTTSDAEEARFKALVATRSGEVAVLLTTDKIGVASHFTVGPATLAHTLFTTGPVPEWLPHGIGVISDHTPEYMPS